MSLYPAAGTFPERNVFFAGTINGIVATPIKLTQEMTEDDFNLWGNLSIGHFCRRLDKSEHYGTGSINKVIEGTLYFWTHKADISVSNPGPEAYNFFHRMIIYTLAEG
jgi:hypothetical protein